MDLLLRLFRRGGYHIHHLPDHILIKIFEMLTIKERLKAERVCERWSNLTKLAWSQTMSKDVCDYFMHKRNLTVDRVILVFSRCARYLDHICLKTSHHAIIGIEDEQKVHELFEVLGRNASKMNRIQWDIQVPIYSLMRFYVKRIKQLEYIDDVVLSTMRIKRLLKILRKAKNVKYYTWNVGIGELIIKDRAKSVIEILPRDLISLEVKSSIDRFKTAVIIEHLHTFENLDTLSLRGVNMLTDDSDDAFQLPSSLRQLEINRLAQTEQICFLRQVESLRHLSISGGMFPTRYLELLVSNNQQIEHLELDNMWFFDEPKCQIVSRLPNLTFLRLSELPLLRGNSLMNFKKINILRMSFCKAVSEQSLIDFVSEAIDLREIELESSPKPETRALRQHLNIIARERDSSITLKVFNPRKNRGRCYCFSKESRPTVRGTRYYGPPRRE